MKKIISISHYPILPPTYGGPIRIYNLYVNLLKQYKFQNFSLSLKNPFLKSRELNKFRVNFFFLPIYSLIALPFWILRFPYGFIFYFDYLLGSIPKDLQRGIVSSDLIIIEEPHLFKWIYKKFPNKIYLLNEQNVEYDLEKQNYKHVNFLLKKIVLTSMKKMEKFALQHSNKITSVSENNKKRLVNLYKINSKKIDVIPNGFINNKKLSIKILSDFRNKLKQVSGINFKYLIIFVGSEHKPNREALKIIKNLAKLSYSKQVLFIIVGSVGNIKDNVKGQNIYYTGVVKDIHPYLQNAEIAINPIISGSGTNIKIFEYLSAGIPIITTKKGARGIRDDEGSFIQSPINNFHLHINNLLTDETLRMSLSKKAISLADKLDDWIMLSKKMKYVVEKIFYETN